MTLELGAKFMALARFHSLVSRLSAQLSIAHSTGSRKAWYLSPCKCDVIGKWSSSIFVFVQPTTPLMLDVYDSHPLLAGHTVCVYKQTRWECKTP